MKKAATIAGQKTENLFIIILRLRNYRLNSTHKSTAGILPPKGLYCRKVGRKDGKIILPWRKEDCDLTKVRICGGKSCG
jgi:hypothetical protein